MGQKNWYYADGDKPLGVFSKQDLMHFKSTGKINEHTLVWCEGMENWESVKVAFQVTPIVDAQQPLVGTAGPNHKISKGNGAQEVEIGVYLGFLEAIAVCFRKAIVFSGRASRSEYWWFVLFCLVTVTASEVINQSSGGLSALVSLALLLPSLAVAIRRMHDVKRSGWWVGSLYLSPLAFVLLVAMSGSRGSYDWLLGLIGFSYLINILVVLVFSLKKGVS